MGFRVLILGFLGLGFRFGAQGSDGSCLTRVFGSSCDVWFIGFRAVQDERLREYKGIGFREYKGLGFREYNGGKHESRLP